MATLTLTPLGGVALNLMDSTAVFLERDGSIEGLLAAVTYDEEYAESADTEGARRIRSRPTNPVRTGKVKITGSTSTTFWANVHTWEQTAEAVRRDGGTLVYTPTNGTATTFDIESFRLTSLPQDNILISQNLCESEFEFTCKPYGRQASVTVASNTTSTEPVFAVSFDATKVPGSVDALGTLSLTDLATQDRNHAEWGLDPDNTGNIHIDSAAMGTTGYAGTAAAITGAYGGTALRATLTTSPLTLTATAAQSHTRRWRVKARVYFTGTGPTYVRLAWKVGEGSLTRNSWAKVTVPSTFYEVDLGLVEIPTVSTGTQAWTGRIEAYSDTNSDTFAVDYLICLPAYRYGKLRSPTPTTFPTTLTGWDGFNRGTAALTGGTASDGTNIWTVVAGGDADDFTIASDFALQRTAVSDASSTPRAVSLGSTSYAATMAQVVTRTTTAPVSNAWLGGAFVRLVNINSHLVLGRTLTSTYGAVQLVKTVGGTVTILSQVTSPWLDTQTALTARVGVLADGTWTVYYDVPGNGPTVRDQGQDTDLATGGTLASGKVGLYDFYSSATALTRRYDDFSFWTPESLGHVINSGKSVQVSDQTAIREPSSGAVWGRVPSYEGAYLKIPPNKAMRLVVKARRLDIDAYPDASIADNLRADISCVPRVIAL